MKHGSVATPNQVLIYDNDSKFKLYFAMLYDQFGIKLKSTTVKNTQ